MKEAYKQVASLRFQEAEKSLELINKNDPDNLMRLHVENYLDFFKVYIDEDKDEFERLEKNKEKRLDEIADNGDKDSPYYLYLQADIRLQWALARLKFEEYATAFFETNKAFKLLSKNVEKYPGFLPNKKDLGILHAIVGTIPDNYKWAINWFSSMDGTIEQGRGELEEVIAFAQENDFIYESEIYIFYAYLLLHLGNDKKEAWRIISASNLNVKNDPIACFIKANLAMRTGKVDEAIVLLEGRPSGPEFHPFYYLDYMTGIAKLQRLDDDAAQYLLNYVNNFKGRNFIKDAYQKLAWTELLQGNKEGYRSYMESCKSNGYTVVGSDQSANTEAKEGAIPHIDLLKARLLFDGGQYQRAYEILKDKKQGEFDSQKDKLELKYRLGRIAHNLGQFEAALNYYQIAIDKGRNKSWYFACRAALEKGLIYESQGAKSLAVAAFKDCLGISPDDHKQGLHQQAKAGLRRLKN